MADKTHMDHSVWKERMLYSTWKTEDLEQYDCWNLVLSPDKLYRINTNTTPALPPIT